MKVILQVLFMGTILLTIQERAVGEYDSTSTKEVMTSGFNYADWYRDTSRALATIDSLSSRWLNGTTLNQLFLDVDQQLKIAHQQASHSIENRNFEQDVERLRIAGTKLAFMHSKVVTNQTSNPAIKYLREGDHVQIIESTSLEPIPQERLIFQSLTYSHTEVAFPFMIPMEFYHFIDLNNRRSVRIASSSIKLLKLVPREDPTDSHVDKIKNQLPLIEKLLSKQDDKEATTEKIGKILFIHKAQCVGSISIF